MQEENRVTSRVIPAVDERMAKALERPAERHVLEEERTPHYRKITDRQGWPATEPCWSKVRITRIMPDGSRMTQRRSPGGVWGPWEPGDGAPS